METDCLTSGTKDVDEVTANELASQQLDTDSRSANKPNDNYYPLVYREPEESPKPDSDGQESGGDKKAQVSRRSLPLRYASHSSCDSSPTSDTHPNATATTTTTTTGIDHEPIDSSTRIRLSSVLVKRVHGNSDDADDGGGGGCNDDDLDSKRRKEELMQSQRSNRQVFDRNKRMFGMLMGTLKKFKTEETSREEVTLKRTKIDERLLESGNVVDLGARDSPPASRNPGQAEDERSEIIDKAEMKLDIVGRLKNWEMSYKHLAGFIQTETRPKVFWLPKEHNSVTEKQLKSTRDYYNLFMAERAAKCKKELEDLEKAPASSFVEVNRRSRESTRSPEPRSRRRRRSRDYRSPASNSSSSYSSDSFRR